MGVRVLLNANMLMWMEGWLRVPYMASAYTSLEGL
jgi:hypothetical protein